MTIIDVEEFDEREYKAVKALLAQLTQSPRELSRERYEALIAADDTRLLLARDGDTVAGMLTLAVYTTPSGRRAWIEDVVVDSAFRGRGYARALVEYGIMLARRADADTVALTSNPARVAANKLYRSLGFEQYETNYYRIKVK